MIKSEPIMKKDKQFFFLISLFIGLALLLGVNLSLARADQYEEKEPSLQIWLDKKVENPESNQYVDNLSVSDYKFAPGEEVWFNVKIKNTGEKTFEKVKVKDYLPDYVQHLEGDLEREYQDLKPDEEREFKIKVKVAAADKLPSDQGVYCVINKAEVEANNQKDGDTSQICIEKKVLGAVVQPEAGSHLFVFSLSILLISLIAFIYDKKFKTVS